MSECLLLTSNWLCAGVVVLVLTSQIVGTVSRFSALMKDWVSAYSDSESVGEENREFVEMSSRQGRSWVNSPFLEKLRLGKSMSEIPGYISTCISGMLVKALPFKWYC